MKYSIAVIGLLFSILSFAQEKEQTKTYVNKKSSIQLIFADGDCNGTTGKVLPVKDLFIKDKSINKINLFLQSGRFAYDYDFDSLFEKSFNVYYFEYGCTRPSVPCVKKYNYHTFAWLTNQYGKKWRRKIRKDVIGYKEWRRNRKLREEYLSKMK